MLRSKPYPEIPEVVDIWEIFQKLDGLEMNGLVVTYFFDNSVKLSLALHLHQVRRKCTFRNALEAARRGRVLWSCY